MSVTTPHLLAGCLLHLFETASAISHTLHWSGLRSFIQDLIAHADDSMKTHLLKGDLSPTNEPVLLLNLGRDKAV